MMLIFMYATAFTKLNQTKRNQTLNNFVPLVLAVKLEEIQKTTEKQRFEK